MTVRGPEQGSFPGVRLAGFLSRGAFSDALFSHQSGRLGRENRVSVRECGRGVFLP